MKWGKKYKTKCGDTYRIVCVDRVNDCGCPVIAVSEDLSGSIVTYRKDGRYSAVGEKPYLDLIEISEWDDFKIDEPVMMRNHVCFWMKGYFAGVSETGKPQTRDNGKTSWTGRGVSSWDECRRPTEEELNND